MIYTLLGLYLLFYGTWLFYIAFMGIKTHQSLIKSKIGYVWHGLYPLFILALFMDVLFNWVIGTMYFREIPKELLFTTRCQRHMKGQGKQLARAQRVCTYLLDPFEEGGHC